MGLVPLAVGKSNLVGIPYSPLAITVIGGLTTSTLLTLFVVPVLYDVLDSFRSYMTTVTGFFLRLSRRSQVVGDQSVE